MDFQNGNLKANIVSTDSNVRLLFIRHGETDKNRGNTVQGQIDEPLNQRGKKQSQRVRRIIDELSSSIDLIYSSDLSRALDTAKEAFPDREIQTDARLREQDFGQLQDGVMEEYNENHPEYKLENQGIEIAYPGGESTRDVFNRVQSSIEDIIYECDNGTAVIFLHMTPIFCIQAYFEGISIKEAEKADNCDVMVYANHVGDFERVEWKSLKNS